MRLLMPAAIEAAQIHASILLTPGVRLGSHESGRSSVLVGSTWQVALRLARSHP
jgi:hypothetical protein